MLLQEGQYAFDPKFNATLLNKRYTIYPIVCHTEYYFAMPGVNDYLNNVFRNLVNPVALPNVTIKDLAVVDLTTLLQLAIHGKGFSDLQDLIDLYIHISTARKKKYARTPMTRDFYNKMAGFDEIYRTRARYDLINPKGGRDAKISELLGLVDTELFEEI